MKNSENTLINSRKGRYGITEQKKAELDRLTFEVMDAENAVLQLQAVVDSLTRKSATYTSFMAEAHGNKERALSNKVLAIQVINSTLSLLNNSEIAYNEVLLADQNTKDLARMIKNLMDKLIYSVEFINKLSNTVIRKKAQNKFISDDIISAINQAGNEGNNAVALTLVALQSTFAAQASNIESEADATLQLSQAITLYQTITGTRETLSQATNAMYGIPMAFDEKTEVAEGSLWALLARAYTDAANQYEDAKKANDNASKELAAASANLESARINLKSLQLSLAAANAAALAS